MYISLSKPCHSYSETPTEENTDSGKCVFKNNGIFNKKKKRKKSRIGLDFIHWELIGW